MGKRKTKEELIKELDVIYKGKYTYGDLVYVNNKTPVIINCTKHGNFEKRPDVLIIGRGCFECYIDSDKNRSYKYTTEEFIEKSNILHDNKYDYSKVVYKNNKTKVVIICKNHGEFSQIAGNHFNDRGCKKCAVEEHANRCRSDIKLIIVNFKKVHGDYYDYSLVDYKNCDGYIKIICKKHGEFERTSRVHTNGYGCSNCPDKISSGEFIIKNFLESNNIIFEREKKFKDCIDKRELPFDFYLPSNNLIIEFDGEQHFMENHHFIYDKSHDVIKNKYCLDNNIEILRIKYNSNIYDILYKHFSIY